MVKNQNSFALTIMFVPVKNEPARCAYYVSICCGYFHAKHFVMFLWWGTKSCCF